MTSNADCAHCGDKKCDARQQRPGEDGQAFLQRQQMAARMCRIKHKVLVLSGKGGVGKSMVAVNLAVALAKADNRVGLLDVDIHGPSVPKMLKMERERVEVDGTTLSPIRVACQRGRLSVMSMGLVLPRRGQAVIRRGPGKFGLIKQFLSGVDWGELEYLVVDSPPGTGDEPLCVALLIEHLDGAVIVTTPQEVALQDVRRSITFCRQLNLPVLGLVENMSGFVCPHCHEVSSIFGVGGGKIMARDMRVPFLGSIPFEREVVTSGENGRPVVQSHPYSETAQSVNRIVARLTEPDLSASANQSHRDRNLCKSPRQHP